MKKKKKEETRRWPRAEQEIIKRKETGSGRETVYRAARERDKLRKRPFVSKSEKLYSKCIGATCERERERQAREGKRERWRGREKWRVETKRDGVRRGPDGRGVEEGELRWEGIREGGSIPHTCTRVSGLSIRIRMNALTHRVGLKSSPLFPSRSRVSLTLLSPASIDSAHRALCCSWMCIINTVRANSAESPIISRGKLYVNAPLMASFVNGIAVQARGIEPCPGEPRFDSLKHAGESSFNAATVIVSRIALSYRICAHYAAPRKNLGKYP